MTNQQHNSATPVVLRLRPELRCSLHEKGGKPYYLVEDLATGSFFRMGVREWQLASQLDGRTSLPEALQRSQRDNRDSALSPEAGESVLRCLLAQGLAEPVAADGHVARVANAGAAQPAKVSAFFIRIPLIYPDRWLAAALPWCRWLISRPFLAVWAAVVVWGGYGVVSHWPRFAASTLTYLAPQTWVYLALVWCLLKVIHEFFHGLVCKKFGGYVGAAGIALILLSPVAFVEVTSAWRFRSKWHRIYTSAAGIYIELFIAGVAAIVWSHVEAGVLSHVCHSVVLMASLTTILFNANPLMRFDGYYMLSDLAEVQNLSGAGQQFVRGVLRQYFLGLPTPNLEEKNRGRRWFVNAYGVAAAMWRVLVCASLTLGAATLFHGAGLVLALFGFVSWLAVPSFRLARFVIVGQKETKPSRIRFAFMTALTGLVAGAILWLPWPGGASAPAVVAYTPEDIVRTRTAGFVEQVHVAAGERVTRDQLLVTLRNEPLQAKLAAAKLAVEQSIIRARILHRDEDLAGYQAEQVHLAALKKKQAHLASQVDGLVVRAPMDGYVLGQRREGLIGQFMKVGAPLIRIADERRKEIRVSIPESYVDAFLQRVGTVPRVRVQGRLVKIKPGPLTKVAPQASLVLRDAALSGRYGGPLAVQASHFDEAGTKGEKPRLKLVAPRFRGVVALSAEEALKLRSGQLAKVRVYDPNETLGRRTYRAVQGWIQKKLHQRITNQT